MSIDRATIFTSYILFSVTILFFTFVLINTNPNIVQDEDGNNSTLKSVGYSFIFSLIFTLIISYLSIRADRQKL